MSDIQSAKLSNKQTLQKTQSNKHQFVVNANLTLHTNIVHNLVNSGWRRGNIGLAQFLLQISKIYRSSQADDPYADWYLMKTYDAIYNARVNLKKIEEKIAQHLSSNRGMRIQHAPTAPWKHEIRVLNPFCYMGASLLTELDYVVCQTLIMRHVCAKSESESFIKQATKELQDAFSVPLNWKKTNVTRLDVRNENQTAIEAKAKFQDPLPDEILNQEIEFSYLPKVK